MAPRPVPSPPAPDIAEEMRAIGEEIRAAQDKLHGVERRMVALTDESAPVFAAMSAFSGVMYRVVGVIGSIVTAHQPAITADDIKELNRASAQNATAQVAYAIKQAVVQNYRWWFISGGAAVVLAILFGLGAGWLLWGSAQPWSGLTCQDQTDGSRVCYMFVRPPNAAERK